MQATLNDVHDVRVSTSEDAERFRLRWRSVLTHTHTYSGRADHGGTVRPPESYRRLSEWAHRHGIDALGMGSPYTPRTAKTYARFDGDERTSYYGGGVNQTVLRQVDEIEGMLRDVSTESCNGTLFYLDNETPKGRFGHLWWVGYHMDFPAWHDYDQDFDRWMVHQSQPGDDGDEPMGYHRRPYAQVVAAQRALGALGFWAHPTSWWRGDRGQFVTNIASEMPAHLIAEGFVDGMVVMGYQPYRPQYLALWHKLLDAGFRVPAVAEMDCGLSDPDTWSRDRVMLNYVAVDRRAPRPLPSIDPVAASLRAGSLFCSSGPLVDLRVDGVPMGGVARASCVAAHDVEITAFPEAGEPTIARLELVGRRGVLWSADRFAGGVATLRIPVSTERGWLVVRAFGDTTPDRCTDHRGVRSFAVSNPVYLHPDGQTFEGPTTTRLTLRCPIDSPWHGAEVIFENAAGERLENGTLRDNITATLPATGRVTLAAPDGRRRTEYLITANQALMQAQRYLYRGRFLRDFPSCVAGEVPPEAWRLDSYRDAMRAMSLTV